MLEADVEVGGRELSLLVTLTLKAHLLGHFHARLHVDSDRGFLSLDSATIETKDLLLVVDLLARSVVHLLKGDINGDIDILSRLRCGLIETSVGRTKVTAFDLKVGACDLSQVRAQVKEGVRLEEELVEDLVTVFLVLVATTIDAIWASDALSETLIAILLINASELLVGKHLVGLTDEVELWQVHAHLIGVLVRVVLESILFEPVCRR